MLARTALTGRTGAGNEVLCRRLALATTEPRLLAVDSANPNQGMRPAKMTRVYSRGESVSRPGRRILKMKT